MRIHTSIARTVLVILAGIATGATADELTMMVEQDLARLGYETGPVDGEETIETVIAISKFQAENNVAVTGEVSAELARTLMAAQPAGASSAPVTTSSVAAAPAPVAADSAAAPPAPAMDPATLQAAQNACLQEKAAAAQAAQKTKRGLGRLFRAVTRTAAREGNYELARTAGDIYYAGATADDLSAAAKDLGLTEDDVTACQNPPM
jgi:peptidoglycan hydrolase-like protein with peptidoglycan-binding domain